MFPGFSWMFARSVGQRRPSTKGLRTSMGSMDVPRLLWMFACSRQLGVPQNIHASHGCSEVSMDVRPLCMDVRPCSLAATASPSPLKHPTRRGKKGFRPLRDGGVEAGERDSLMDPRQGTRGEPSEDPIPIVDYTPAIRHRSRGGAMLNGAPRSKSSPPQRKALRGPNRHRDDPGWMHLRKGASCGKRA